jgi:beta-hydroxylase
MTKGQNLFRRFITATKIDNTDEYLRQREDMINKLVHEEGLNNLLDELELNYEQLKEEFYRVSSEEDFVEYPLIHLYKFGWDVVGLKYEGINVSIHHKKYPVLSTIVRKYDSIIRLAGYSRLKSKAVIGLHRDYQHEVTLHLSITIPKGDCVFRMADVSTKWEEGKTHFFYSHDPHDAWNLTDEDRIILIMDVKSRNRFQKFIHRLTNNRLTEYLFHKIYLMFYYKKHKKK